MIQSSAKVRGFTLVELMIALTVGSLLTTAVLASYIATSRSMAEDERYALLQENGRYALKTLTDELTMADFWGQMIDPSVITEALGATGGNCADALDLYDASTAARFNNYHENPQGAAPPDVHFTPCNELLSDHLGGTDLIAIKRVEGSPAARTFVDVTDTNGNGNTTEVLTEGSGVADVIYLRTNGTVGEFIDDADTSAPALGESDWKYVPRVYFIRDFSITAGDGIPSLCRLDLVVSGATVGLGRLTDPATSAGVLDEATCLAEGVEDMHLQFGVDTDQDGVPNRYLVEPTEADMEGVVSARIYLLVRSSTAVPHYTNAKSYTLGDVAIAAANDGFFRRVYSTTVAMRNSANLNLLNQ